MFWNDTPITVAGYIVNLVHGEMRVGNKALHIPEIRLVTADGEITLHAPLVEYGGRIEADVNATEFSLNVLNIWLKPAGATDTPTDDSPLSSVRKLLASQGSDTRVEGKVTLDATIQGQTVSPEIRRASLNIANLRVTRAPTQEELAEFLKKQTPQGTGSGRVIVAAIDRLDINNLNLANGKIVSDSLGVSVGNTVVRGKADLSGFAWQPPFLLPTAKYHAEAKLVLRDENEQNLQELATLLPGILSPYSKGQATASAAIDRDGANPIRIFGTVRLAAPQLELARFRSGLRDVDGTIVFDGKTVRVDSFKAQSQVYDSKGRPLGDPGSPIRLTGSLPLNQTGDPTQTVQEGIHLVADRATFAERPLPGSMTGAVRGVASVKMDVDRDLLRPRLTGNITVSDAQIALPSDFGGLPAGTGEPTINPRFRDLKITLDKNVRVSNPLLNTVVTGGVTVTGTLSAPNLAGTLALNGGKLSLATTRLTIQSPSTILINYPVFDAGQSILGLYVNLQAEGNLTRTTFSNTRTSERVSFRITGPLTGSVIDPVTGQSKLLVTSNSPNFDQDTLLQSLIIGDQSRVSQIGSNPTQAVAGLLTNAITDSFLPGIFDRTAEQLGFEELSVGYDSFSNLNLNVTRKLFGPFSATYTRTLSGVVERYTLRFSARLNDRLQASYETNETSEQRYLLEGVWQFK